MQASTFTTTTTTATTTGGSSLHGCLRSLGFHQVVALLVRLALIVYGQHHDRTHALPYTDVDYHVITDAAHHVISGDSPFLRHTYRYTPFLAWLMMPNVLLHFCVGKIIFSLLDCVAARVIYNTLLLQGCSKTTALKCSFLWLHNPIVIAISTRGSSESLVATLVLLLIYFHQQQKTILSGIILGGAIHFKIYPIIYCLPLYLSLEEQSGKHLMQRFYPTVARIKLTISTIVAFGVLTLAAYLLYGIDYIQEAFIYHVSRIDTRHNFSVYFYLLYLSNDYNIPGLSIATFSPQFILVFSYGLVYGTRNDVILSLFSQTVVFVTFNKVVTSQYFLWYLLFIPLLCCRLQLSRLKVILLPGVWMVCQCAWLLPAYLLEFHGLNVFVPIWLESIAFFCCNVSVLMAIMSSYWAYSADQQSGKHKME